MLPARLSAQWLPPQFGALCTQPPAWLLALGSGVLLSLAFPCHPAHVLAPVYHPAWAWIGLVPLLIALRRTDVPGPFRLGWMTGSVWALFTLYWVAHTQGGGLAVAGATFLMAAYLGLYTALFAKAQHMLLQRGGDLALLAAPFLWSACEYLSSLGELGFPWLLLGHSQAAYPSLIQYAGVTGAYGVSAWAVLVNALCALALTRERPVQRGAWALAGLTILALPALYATQVAPAVDNKGNARVRVSVVQPGLFGQEKWSPGGVERTLQHLEKLSRQAAASGPELLVWPETAVPCHVRLRPQCRARIQALVDELGIPLLTGAADYSRERREPYNAAFLLQPGKPTMQRYAKMHLVPFGERTPFRDRIPLLRRIDWSVLTRDLGPAEFAPGQQRVLFDVPGARAVVLICFEAVFPDFTRRGVKQGGRLLVNITNDSWFGDTAGPFQHARLAVMRAVENRTAMARCASTGLSLFVDPYGRTHGTTALGEQAVRTYDLQVANHVTLYTRYGDWFAQGSLLVSLLMVVLARASRGRPK